MSFVPCDEVNSTNMKRVDNSFQVLLLELDYFERTREKRSRMDKDTH